ncbi:MAG: hypothetical protein K9H26_07050 [Prolixibacteraceae bacterium]|nr:hypothetical protein [Prolixibacteraceae bacterium]
MNIEEEIIIELKKHGAGFHYFIDVSHIAETQNKGYPAAVLFGMTLSADFVKKVVATPNYVQNMIRNGLMNEDEFNLKEIRANNMADHLASFITKKGYGAYSQSEENIEKTGYYDNKNFITPLPHKTIARLAGLGWIGKNDLLINPEMGCAFCMCSVLTDAPLNTESHQSLPSECGDCDVCVKICPVDAICGKNWDEAQSRDELVNVHKCITCLKCMVFCPYTKTYMENNLKPKHN